MSHCWAAGPTRHGVLAVNQGHCDYSNHPNCRFHAACVLRCKQRHMLHGSLPVSTQVSWTSWGPILQASGWEGSHASWSCPIEGSMPGRRRTGIAFLFVVYVTNHLHYRLVLSGFVLRVESKSFLCFSHVTKMITGWPTGCINNPLYM